MIIQILFALLFLVNHLLGDDTIVFSQGEAGYYCVRIPALLTTARGTLIAFGEARMFTCADDTQIDIVYKRSLDNGKTWSTLTILHRGNVSGANFNWVGNFAPVQLNYNQRILVPFCKNNLIPMLSFSDDDGLTFSQPQMIPNITKPDWKWFALGPPGGLLLKSNRIVIPGDYSTGFAGKSTGFVMINDFNGEADKWYLGGEYRLDNYYPNEGQAVELLPRTNLIFINARSSSTNRIGAYSSDGGLTFNKITTLKTLVEPPNGCEGSMVNHQISKRLFYSGLSNTSIIRHNISLYTSIDNGENWIYMKSIFQGHSGYSSLTILNDQSIAVLYEKGSTRGAPDSLSFCIVFNQTKDF